jgi:hypothetical protein
MTSAGAHPNAGARPPCALAPPAALCDHDRMDMHTLAVTATVSGIDGFFYVVAVILFLISAIVAWFVAPRQIWATFVAAGLMLVALAKIVT